MQKLETKEKEILALRIAYITGIFSLIVCIVMLLNYWQLVSTDPLDNESLKTLVEKFQDDNKNEELKQDIRNLDLMARNAYFTKQWQIRSGAYLLIGGVVLMIIALRVYYSSKSDIDIPDRKETRLDIELLSSRRWILYSLVILFGLALVSSYLSIDHLQETYAITDVNDIDDDVPTQEIIPVDQQSTTPAILENVVNTSVSEQDTQTDVPDTGSEVKVTDEIDEEPILDQAENTAEGSTKKPSAPEPKKVSPYPTHEELLGQHPSFRGPYGLGISSHKSIPTSWDGASGENILWKIEIPLEGYNSPVIWDKKVFVTGANETSQIIYCYDLNSGALIWEHSVSDITRASTGKIRPTEDTGFAAPTVATDGRNVFAIFATGDVVGLDINGNRLWGRNLGTPDNHYGHSSSLLLWKDKLFVQFDTNRAGKVMALNTVSGETSWETARLSKISWASPILADVGNHKELVLSSSPQVAAYDPETGKELWTLDCLSGEIGPSPGFLDGVVFAANEYANLVAIKPGSPAEILWENNEYLPEVASPVAYNGLLYIATSYGVLACFDAVSGEMLWEYEADQGFYASPIIADGKLFCLDMDGIMHIISLERTMRLINKSELGEPTVSTPALAEGKILIRGYHHLYCIGK